MILEEDKVMQVDKRFQSLKSDRANWDWHWEDIVELINPRKANQWTKTRGEKRMENVFDAGPIHANQMLSNAFHSRLTNPAVPWFALTTGDSETDAEKPVAKYLQDVSRVLHETLNQSNFQSQVAEYYTDLTSLCTAVLLCEEDDEDEVRFKCSPIWDHYIAENHLGKVDTIFTEYEWDFRSIVQKFGKEPFRHKPDWMHQFDVMSKAPSTQKYKVVHAVFPRSDRDITKLDVTNKPFASVYYLQKGHIPLKNSGFDENPYIVSRFSVTSGEFYGRGPGTMSLPDVRMLNVMIMTVIKYAQKATDPPLLVPDDGYLQPKTFPGAVNTYRAGTDDRLQYLEPAGNHGVSIEMIDRVQRKIDQAFYVDQLQLLEQSRMTATEVSTRNDERMTLLAPVLARQHYEFLKPLIDRVFGVLERRGMLPAPPDILLEKNLGIEYSSQIARAQKRSTVANVQGFMNVIAPFMQVSPAAQHIIDGDAVVRYVAKQMDVPQEVLRSKEDVEDILEQQAEIARQQQEAQMMQQQAQTQGQEIQNRQMEGQQ